MVDVVVGHALTLGVGNSLVVVLFFRELGNNVPGMEKAGDESETAEEDIDEGIDTADAPLDPDGDGRENDG